MHIKTIGEELGEAQQTQRDFYSSKRDIPYVPKDYFAYIGCQKLDEKATPPAQGKPGDAGYDLYALEDIVIPGLFSRCFNAIKSLITSDIYGKLKWSSIKTTIPELLATKVRTGIALQIPNGCVGLIMDRSGLGSKLIKVFGGVIDSNYRGEVIVCLGNFTFTDYSIKAGDRVAQIVVQECKSYPVHILDKLEESNRGDKGFGSSGA